jgi:hypothetical protein
MTHHFTETSEYHKKKVEGDLYQDHKMLWKICLLYL